MFRKSKNLQANKGMALVMSLLIMSLIMVSALAFSRIIFGEIRMSLNVINSIGSFYTADAGMEKSLFYLKYAKLSSNLANFEGLVNDPDVIFNSNNQSFKIVVADSSYVGFTAYDVTSSSPAQVDIVDPVGNIDTISWPIPASIYKIEWYVDSCWPYHASDRLEVSYTSFGENFFNPIIEKDIIVCNCSYNTQDKCSTQVAGYSIANDRYYSFSFRPLNDTVSRLDFNLSDGTNNLGILSQVAITVDGAYKNSQYRLKANLPAISPLSNVFSYVIFSEESLIKDL